MAVLGSVIYLGTDINRTSAENSSASLRSLRRDIDAPLWLLPVCGSQSNKAEAEDPMKRTTASQLPSLSTPRSEAGIDPAWCDSRVTATPPWASPTGGGDPAVIIRVLRTRLDEVRRMLDCDSKMVVELQKLLRKPAVIQIYSFSDGT